MDPQKLATVIPIEARKYIPVPISEVQLDWFIVPETEQRLFEGETDMSKAHKELQRRLVLVVAMHDEVLHRYNTAVSKVGLLPLFYEIEVFSSVRATVSHSIAPVAILDIGAGTAKLYLVELGIVLASHIISVGAQDITRSLSSSTHVSLAEAEEMKRNIGIAQNTGDIRADQIAHLSILTMERVCVETRRVIAGFQKKYNKVITKVILVGGGASLKGFEDLAKQQLEIEIEVANPFLHIHAPAFLEQSLREIGPTFSTAIGLALRGLKE
jgi:type IV pilus assembly protein PilM